MSTSVEASRAPTRRGGYDGPPYPQNAYPGVRLVVVETADARVAIDRMDRGEAETYGWQYYSLGYVLGAAERADSATTIMTMTEAFEERRGALGLVGLTYWGEGGPARLDAALAAAAPTHIVLRTPLVHVAAWARRRGVPLLPIFADSFSVSGWSPRAARQRLRHARLAREIRRGKVTLACNHNRAASRDLVRIGVPKAMVLPWEWPTGERPDAYAPKTLREAPPFRLLYVGTMDRAKGVHDAVEAFANDAWLRANAGLTLVGGGDQAEVRALIEASGLGDTVTLTGRVPSERVAGEMRRADIVLVPSHHAYPEGLPKTIREGLTVRTPLIVTDHPMFRGYFDGNPAASVVRERAPGEIAAAARALLSDPERYAAASVATASAFDSVDWPHKWAEVIDHWLRGDPDGYLARHRGRWD